MPIFTRTNGGASPVTNTANAAIGGQDTQAVIIATGIGKPVQAFGVNANASIATAFGAGEAIEVALRAVASRATILAYQVDSPLLSVLVEENDWTTGTLQSNINAALIGAGINVSTTVTDVGMKLQLS
jgi:hypothetical protein